MLTAKEARNQSIKNLGDAHRTILFNLKDYIGQQVEKAAAKGLCQVSVVIPQEMDPILVSAFVRTLKQQGYQAKLEYRTGALEQSLYQSPKTTLTIRW